MSAFVVSHSHIDALLSFSVSMGRDRISYWDAKTETRGQIDHETATEVGRILLKENVRSVLARYPQDSEDSCPGTIGETSDGYVFKSFKPFLARHHSRPSAAVAILKGCDCFDYQACETDDYPTTLAHTIIDAIRHAAIRSLVGYENAPWGFDLMEKAKAA